MRPAQVHAAIRRTARERGRLPQEIFTLYGLERFVARLAMSPFRDDFALKGGVLLAAHRLRRPTRDVDVQALDVTLDEQHLRAVVAAVADTGHEDGVVIDPSVMIEQIRDDDEYSGLRVHMRATVHTFEMDLKLDVSTGDPIWPEPEVVHLPALLGGVIAVLGHPLPTVIAEKTITMLQRGTTSTRWRDFVDVRSLARAYSYRAVDLRGAASAVAAHRQVDLGPIGPVTEGYGAVAQARWAAWRRRNALADAALAAFDAQLADVLAFIDPVYSGAAADEARWDPDEYRWVQV